MDENKKPLLVYDGDCQFCYYWVQYWKQLTHDQIIYKTYQEVAHQYPHIPISEFKNAVQYFDANGNRARGAKASFLVLKHAKGKSQI